MIDENTNKAFQYYLDQHLKSYTANNYSERADFWTLGKRQHMEHAKWMCLEVLKPENAHYSIDKKSRWLGFVQALIILNGYSTIKEERDITRPWFKHTKI